MKNFVLKASKAEGLERAKSMIERMFQEIEVGKVYTGKIVSIWPSMCMKCPGRQRASSSLRSIGMESARLRRP